MKDSKKKSNSQTDIVSNEERQSRQAEYDNVPQVPNRAHTEMKSDNKKAKG